MPHFDAQQCPWCGAAEVYRSRQPLLLLSMLRLETWRCQRCGRRFPLRPGSSEPLPTVPPVADDQSSGAELRALDETLSQLLKSEARGDVPLPSFELGEPREPRKRGHAG